jgi:hypothetical protein
MQNIYAISLFISISAFIVAMMNIRKAIFVGAWSMCISIFLIFCVYLYEMQAKAIQLKNILLNSLNSIVLLALSLFYIGYCLLNNKSYIMDSSMPNAWYTFSYFTMAMIFINNVLLYLSTQQDTFSSFLIIGNSLLFAFVVIETIICVSFRTDGFTL